MRGGNRGVLGRQARLNVENRLLADGDEAATWAIDVGDQPDHAGNQRAEDRGWNSPLLALQTDSKATEADRDYGNGVKQQEQCSGDAVARREDPGLLQVDRLVQRLHEEGNVQVRVGGVYRHGLLP